MNCSCCRIVDLRITDTVLRLVAPLAPESRYAGTATGQRLHSICLRVPDLGSAARALVAAGITVVSRGDTFLWTDPARTGGLNVQWVQAGS